MNVRGKKIVVTGGTGFLGRRLAAELTEAGADVGALGTSDYDLRDRGAIEAMLADHHPAVVVHLAAVLGGIAVNAAEPGRLFYENAVMGIELLEACRRANVPKIVVAGTISSYPRSASTPFSEEDFWSGYPHESEAPFAMAKKILLTQIIAYRQQYGMNAIYLVPTNLYGPGDALDLETTHVVPAMIRRFLEARERGDDVVTLWGDGAPTREFLYIDDAAVAFRLAIERYDRGEPLNIGSGDELTIRDAATIIQKATGFEGAVAWDHTRPNGPPRRRLYSSNAHRLLGFDAVTPFASGIRATVEWAEQALAGDEERSR